MNVITAENDPSPRCLSGLARILAAADASEERQVTAAIESLLDSLLAGLDLQRAHLRLPRPIEGLPPEFQRTTSPARDDLRLEEVALPLGDGGALGTLTVGATREGFPDPTERMLLDVAALKATHALVMASNAEERRRRDEEAARYKEDLLHQLVDSIAAEVTVSTPEGDIIFVNQTGIDRTGRPSAKHSDWRTSDLIHPDDLPRVKEAWARALATTGAYECDVRSRCVDGIYRWVHSHGFPIKDAQGKVVNWCTLHLDINDRKEAEAARAESEQRLDLVVNTIPAMAWTADTDGNVDFFNKHFLDYVGQPVVALKDGGWKDAVHPDDLDRLLATWKSVMATRQGGEAEARLRRFDGEYRWFLMRVSPLLDNAGKVVKWYGANTDIEDWRRTEKALHTLDFLLNGVAESIAAPLVFLRPDGSVEVANQHLLDFFGKTREQMEGWKSIEIIHPDDRAATITALKTAIETGRPYEVEARRQRADGVYRWWRSNGYPMRDLDGRIVRWCVLYTDVHDRKLAEEALRASELMLRSMVDSVAAPLGFFKPTGELEVVNQMVLDYFGVPFGALADWENIVHPDDLEASSAAWNRSLQTGAPYVFEARIRYRDGSYRWNDHRGYPMRDADGQIVRWCVLQLDVHDRKRMEYALSESERKLDQIIRAAPGLVWSADPDGSATFLNQSFLDYVGRPAEELLGMGYLVALHPDDLERHAAEWGRIQASKQPGEVESRLRRHDGEYRWFLFRGSPVLDDSGAVVKWHGVNIDIEDRKRAEKAAQVSEAALAASERNLRQIINTIPAVVWSADVDGGADYFNKSYLDYMGLSLEEAQGWGWTKAIHPDDLAGLAAAWQDVMATGQGRAAEARLRRFDGEYRWFLFRSNALRDESGKVVKWFGANTDIEEFKRAEEASRESERNLIRQTETIPQMLWSARPDGSFDYCNTRFTDYTGSRTGGVMGDGWKNALHPDDQEATARAWRHSVATGEPYEVEVRKFCAAVGEYHWCLTTALPLRDEEGRIIRWHGSSIDIHDRKMAEQALAASERKLDTIINTIPGMAWSANPDGMCDFFNRHHLDYVGLPMEEMLGTGFVKTFHPDDLPQLLGPWQEMMATGKGGEVEGRIRNRNGEYHRFLFRTNPLFDENGKLVKWFGVNIDIEDRKRAEDELRETQAELAHMTRVTTMGQLTASIAHELNQPLAGIMTNASTGMRMLDANPPNITGARETARRTLRDAGRASEIINRLRALFTKKSTTFEAVDLNLAIQEVIALTSSELQRSGVSLRADLADDLPPVAGDRIQLQQVILNFIMNGSEAMAGVEDRPREIVISTRHDEAGQIRLSVKDAGIGFDALSTEKLFSPFFTTKSSGMGIGLSVSRSIIESHQGRLWAEANQGPGATFSFALPSKPGQELADGGHRRHVETSIGAGMIGNS